MRRFEKSEKEIIKSYEKNEWRSAKNAKETIKNLPSYARQTFQKDRRVNIRMSTKDMEGIQKRALEEGIPYQTLLSSIIHKFLSGRLSEKKS